MKRAFTLIELMVVVGIMAFLGIAATGGYTALQRGMSERGAVAAASSLLKAAKERALVDRSPTMVFCYNRLLREATDDENAIVAGEMVAVRRAGRVTWASGSYIVDEFADVIGSYDIVDKGEIVQRKSMRLWRFDDTRMSSMQYSMVADAVTPLWNDVTLSTYGGWAEGDSGGNTNLPHAVYAFNVNRTSSHEPTAWRPGHGYGFEFATVQLPKDFIFGTSVPSKLGDVIQVKAFYFNPESPSDEQVEIQFCMPNASGLPKAHHRAGHASSKENQNI